ncbi:MAG TPA: hypothetical protein VFV50_14535, partial [Bdellovibrionales bacterium]|nr:hypothetical protein [Bdellovibrionales bacterium]
WELHQHKAGPVKLTAAELIENVSEQFALAQPDSRALIHAVLDAVYEHLGSSGAGLRERVAADLARFT